MSDRIYLDWPDSPGLWWCEGWVFLLKAQRASNGEMQLSMYGMWMFRKQFESIHHIRKFTKLLEPNPFRQ